MAPTRLPWQWVTQRSINELKNSVEALALALTRVLPEEEERMEKSREEVVAKQMDELVDIAEAWT